jgi:hypothetical protein
MHVEQAGFRHISVVVLTLTVLLRIHLLANVDAVDGILCAVVGALIASRVT